MEINFNNFCLCLLFNLFSVFFYTVIDNPLRKERKKKEAEEKERETEERK